MNTQTPSYRQAECGMPAVILAAGRGDRLRQAKSNMPKPLARLLGLTLLERAILSCREAGIRQCYVVIGCYGKVIIPHIEKLGRCTGISVQAIWNPNWPQGNGTSVLAVAPYVSSSFLLLMCDHLFDPQILAALVKAKDRACGCLLAVDHRTDRIFDLDDATKVQLDGQRIRLIGKELPQFDAIDTGLFLCHPIVFDALEKARREGNGSLSAGIQYLIEMNEVQAVEAESRFWLDVDTPQDLSQARRVLLARLCKPHEDGFVSRNLNRPISRLISAWLVRTSLTPNEISSLSFLIALVGAALFSLGDYVWTLVAGLLIQFASVVDGCDGEIARLKFQSSLFGAWFDTVLDRYADVAIVAGISYGYWLTHPGASVWLGAIMALAGFVLASYMKKEYALQRHRKLPGGVVEKLLKRDVRLFALFVGALLNRAFESMILIGLLSHLGIIWTFLTIYRRQRADQVGARGNAMASIDNGACRETFSGTGGPS